MSLVNKIILHPTYTEVLLFPFRYKHVDLGKYIETYHPSFTLRQSKRHKHAIFYDKTKQMTVWSYSPKIIELYEIIVHAELLFI